jgi:hypothetical protein
MILQQEDKNALVTIRLQRAKETLAEVQGNIDLGYWRVAANPYIMRVIMPQAHC